MGLTQHKNAVANIQEIINLLLLGGHFGRAGAGACPVRGHSTVQGDRSMGINERPSAEFLRHLGDEFNFTPPQEHGLSTVEAIEAMHAGNVKVFFAMGGNFLSATPDTQYTAAALNACALTVQVSTNLNRSHLTTWMYTAPGSTAAMAGTARQVRSDLLKVQTAPSRRSFSVSAR